MEASVKHEMLVLHAKAFDDVKVLWIDIDQTLLDFDRTAKQCMQQLFEKYGLEYREGDFENAFLPVNRILWPQIEQSLISLQDLHHIRWHMVLERLNLTHPEVDDFERQFRILLNRSAVPIPGALQALTELACKYPLYIITNGPLRQQKNRLESAGMLEWIREVYASSDLDSCKPDEQFFIRARHLCEKNLGRPLRPQQILVIGDSVYNDIEGARRMGMPSILLAKDGIENSKYKEVQPDAVCSSWKAVCDLLHVR
jgi:FMN phosphatase YigB (HAD superfamily)